MNPDEQNWLINCVKHIRLVREANGRHEFAWKTLTSPNPDAMRAFQGETDQYLVTVVQANVSGRGLVHEAMIVAKMDGCIIRPDTDVADMLWHSASAKSN